MKNLVKKLTSRKFIAALCGIVSGAALLISGNTTEGTAAVIASVLGYLVAEGYIDGKAVKATAQAVEEAVDETE